MKRRGEGGRGRRGRRRECEVRQERVRKGGECDRVVSKGGECDRVVRIR